MSKNAVKIKQTSAWMNSLNGFMSAYFNWLIVITVGAILTSGWLLFISPRYEMINSRIVAVNENLDKEYEKLSRYNKRLDEINGNYNNIRQDNIAKIQQFLPDQADSEELIEKLELVAKKQGLFLSSLSVQSGEAKAAAGGTEAKAVAGLPSEVRQVSISLSLSGVSYDAMKNFIATLEASLRLIDITKLEYQPGDQSLNVEAVAYYLKP